MGTPAKRWLGIAIAALLLAGVAWSTRSSGTQLCVRCGTLDDLKRVGPVVWSSSERPGDGTEWFEAVCGRCVAHEWRRVGCWFEGGLLGGRVSCTEFPPSHALHRECSQFADSELARAVARQFAALTPAQRAETFVAAERALPLGPRPPPPALEDALRAWTLGPTLGPLIFPR